MLYMISSHWVTDGVSLMVIKSKLVYIETFVIIVLYKSTCTTPLPYSSLIFVDNKLILRCLN